MIPFEMWFRRQKNRDCAVGDAAKDYDKHAEKHSAYKIDVEYLKKSGSPKNDIKTIKKAQTEFKAYVAVVECLQVKPK